MRNILILTAMLLLTGCANDVTRSSGGSIKSKYDTHTEVPFLTIGSEQEDVELFLLDLGKDGDIIIHVEEMVDGEIESYDIYGETYKQSIRERIIINCNDTGSQRLVFASMYFKENYTYLGTLLIVQETFENVPTDGLFIRNFEEFSKI